MSNQTGMLQATSTGIGYLLEQLQDDRTLVRENAARQLQRLQSPDPKVIDAVNTALERERDETVRATLEAAQDALAKSTAAVRLNGRSTEQLVFPSICVCCGATDANEEGIILKGNSQRKVGFIWERPDRIQLTVPACKACQQRLDRTTRGAGLVAALFGIFAVGALIFFGSAYLSWFFLIALATWIWVYAAQLGGKLYKSIRHHPQGTTWADLCHYDGETLGFTLPIFQEQFRALNRG